MATLHLESYHRGTTVLPELCMQCGAPGTTRTSKTFSWFPPWIWVFLFVCGLPIFVLIALVMTKRRTVDAVFCEEHKNHWLSRQLLVIGSFLGVVAASVLTMLLVSDNDGRNNNPLGGFLCLGIVVLLVAWLIMAVIVQSKSIRASEITDHSITLAGVSKAFVEAYEQKWHVAPDLLDNLAREHWNQGRRASRAVGSTEEETDHIQPADEEKPGSPPDGFREGLS